MQHRKNLQQQDSDTPVNHKKVNYCDMHLSQFNTYFQMKR